MRRQRSKTEAKYQITVLAGRRKLADLPPVPFEKLVPTITSIGVTIKKLPQTKRCGSKARRLSR